MIAYLLKSTACLLLLLVVYHAFLERETMHYFNRYFLLFSLIFGLSVPLVTLNLGGPVKLSDQINEINSRLQTDNISKVGRTPVPEPRLKADPPTVQNKPNKSMLLWGIYTLGAVLFFVRLLRNLNKLYTSISNNEQTAWEEAILILTNDASQPHSFFNYIFIDKKLYQSEKINRAVLIHELSHVRQRHSLDILFVEILKVLFWFNPVFYFYKKAMQTNHEFLADASVIAEQEDVTNYQRLLLKMKSPIKELPLSSSIKFSITKKRIMMMTKQSSRWFTIGKQLALIPVLAGLILAFSTHTTTAQTVQQMSLTELVSAVSERMDAIDSLTDKEEQQLQNLVTKMQQKLRPEAAPPNPPKKISEKNLLKIFINREGLILMDKEPIPLHKTKEKVKAFITNNGADPELSDSPQKATIALETVQETPYNIYTELLNNMQHAYLEIRNAVAQAEYGVNYEKLVENSPAQTKIREMYPVRISIAEPKQEEAPPPPKPASPAQQIKEASGSTNIEALAERNILQILVNKEGLILANEEPMPLDKLAAKVKVFITNNGSNPELSDSPQAAVVSLKPAAKTPIDRITDIQHEITKAYEQAKDDAAQAEFGKNFEQLEDGSAAKKRIDKMYPARISFQEAD